MRMAKSTQEIVYEGWLTKSPPTESKKIWRGKWRRRWFALRQSGDLPGQYFLEYYSDKNCTKRKGIINLDLCEQVDAGLYMERSGVNSVGNKLRGSVFSVKTQARTYHLEAECEADMEKWVNAICQVCGLKSSDGAFSSNVSSLPDADIAGVYIPISECITGTRISQDNSTYKRNSKRSNSGSDESHSEDDSGNNKTPQWNITMTFTKQTPVTKTNGPPVPPRPPKTFRYDTQNITMCRERSAPIKVHKPPEKRAPTVNHHDQDNLYTNVHLPPAVDRALKPRHTSEFLVTNGCNIFEFNSKFRTNGSYHNSHKLQYLDLDLSTSNPKPSTSRAFDAPKRTISHVKSLSVNESDSAYKSVDFLKTEALNSTREDAEATRHNMNHK